MLRNGLWPFLWVLLIPAVTIPLSVFLQSRVTLFDGTEVGLGSGGRWATSDAALGSFSPGLLNLVAFVWLVFGRGRARWAGLWAGLLGTAGAVLPFVVILNIDSLGPDNVRYVFWTPTVPLVWLGIFDTWLATLGTAIVFRGIVRVRERARDRAREASPAHYQDQQYFTPVRSH